ncbi:MAG: GGDEF domain-containing protein [Bacilli bacterium]|nr:GGDEF domain-containing protein [Bacilli bacterium]
MTNYFVTNFPLFCICIGMGLTAFSNVKTNKKNSMDVFIILGLCLILSVVVYFDIYASLRTNMIILATWMTYLGYVIRPICLYFFIRMSDKTKIVPTWVFIASLLLNALLYAPALFINTGAFNEAVYKYEINEAGTGLLIKTGPLNYTSHIIASCYLVYMIIISFKMISMKHKDDALVVLTCSAFVVVAVTLEALQLVTNLLNITIAISCVFYYLFVNRDKNRRDALTNLYNRKTYFEDVSRNLSRVAGVILFDMNGLKQINDNKGHEEGDKAIITIADAISNSLMRDMSAYRMGGDEFLVLSVFSGEKELLHVAKIVEEKVEKAGYSVSSGIAYHEAKEDVDTLVKRAEIEMYKNKSDYYISHKIERRRR